MRKNGQLLSSSLRRLPEGGGRRDALEAAPRGVSGLRQITILCPDSDEEGRLSDRQDSGTEGFWRFERTNLRRARVSAEPHTSGHQGNEALRSSLSDSKRLRPATPPRREEDHDRLRTSEQSELRLAEHPRGCACPECLLDEAQLQRILGSDSSEPEEEEESSE